MLSGYLTNSGLIPYAKSDGAQEGSAFKGTVIHSSLVLTDCSQSTNALIWTGLSASSGTSA